MRKILYFVCLFFIIISCHKNSKENYIIVPNTTISLTHIKRQPISNSELNEWAFKDILKDTIPGISLNKAYDFLKEKRPKDTIIVAVLDSPIDINHEDFQNQIWINKKEIPDNRIDDDNNGYIDDLRGWNFLGDEKGNQNKFILYESTRILKKYDHLFKHKNPNQIAPEDSLNFHIYTKAKAKYDEQKKAAIEDTAYANMLINISTNARKTLSTYFPKHNYTRESLDSLKQLYPKDTILQDDILRMSNFIKYGFTTNYLEDYKFKADATINKLLNLDYDDRIIQGDNGEDIRDTNYGNGIVNKDLDFSDHGTIVSGIIGAVRQNNIGINGIASSLKIMPICISGYGEVHDKDISLAIRYAVDNGARVINMSFGKDISLHKKWVDEALKYAEENNVLILSSAGNKQKRLDGTNEYPTDSNGDSTEVSSNFVHIGASSSVIEKGLAASFSNYSNIEVDIFAPGRKIKTLTPGNKYKVDSGTSLAAAVVSGIAALVWSYYPELSASEIKKILILSGNSYNIDVEIKQKDGTKKLVPFSELSKSGKVVNAYNALLMAEQISKSKN